MLGHLEEIVSHIGILVTKNHHSRDLHLDFGHAGEHPAHPAVLLSVPIHEHNFVRSNYKLTVNLQFWGRNFVLAKCWIRPKEGEPDEGTGMAES